MPIEEESNTQSHLLKQWKSIGSIVYTTLVDSIVWATYTIITSLKHLYNDYITPLFRQFSNDVSTKLATLEKDKKNQENEMQNNKTTPEKNDK